MKVKTILATTVGILSLIALATQLQAPTPEKETSPQIRANNPERILDNEESDVFTLWFGGKILGYIFGYIFVIPRYVAIGFLCVGCVLSTPGKNKGWMRLIRYITFIYCISQFKVNMTNFGKTAYGLTRTSYLEHSNLKEFLESYYTTSILGLFGLEQL